MSQVRYINVYEAPVFARGCHGIIVGVSSVERAYGSPVSSLEESDRFAESYYRGTGRRRIYRLRVTRKLRVSQ